MAVLTRTLAINGWVSPQRINGVDAYETFNCIDDDGFRQFCVFKMIRIIKRCLGVFHLVFEAQAGKTTKLN